MYLHALESPECSASPTLGLGQMTIKSLIIAYGRLGSRARAISASCILKYFIAVFRYAAAETDDVVSDVAVSALLSTGLTIRRSRAFGIAFCPVETVSEPSE